jgi:hypothetical protein
MHAKKRGDKIYSLETTFSCFDLMGLELESSAFICERFYVVGPKAFCKDQLFLYLASSYVF